VDDLTILAELRGEAPEPDADRLRRLRRRVMRPRRGFVLMPSVLLAAVAVVAVVAVAVSGSRPPSAVPPPADTILLNSETGLEKAAKTVEKRAGAPEPRHDQWQYTKSLDVQPADGRTMTREGWLRYDGEQSAGRDMEGTFRVRDVPPDPGDDDLSPRQYRQKLVKLPTDPDKLLAHVQGDRHWIDYPKEEGVPKAVEDPDSRAYRILSLYLKQQAVMPPELEAAIFRAMAKIPGVRIEQEVRDATGRTGLGLFRSTIGQEGVRRYLILDPRTYRVMADQTVWLRDEVIGGEVAFHKGAVLADVLLASGIVDKPGELP
jgi:hypothetical protein